MDGTAFDGGRFSAHKERQATVAYVRRSSTTSRLMSNFFNNMFRGSSRGSRQSARPPRGVPHTMFDEFLNGMAQAAGGGLHAQGGGLNVQQDPEQGPPPTARRILLSLKVEDCPLYLDIKSPNYAT